jgi:two-component system, cell cycle sensor histidine kinase and response regulator CckA
VSSIKPVKRETGRLIKRYTHDFDQWTVLLSADKRFESLAQNQRKCSGLKQVGGQFARKTEHARERLQTNFDERDSRLMNIAGSNNQLIILLVEDSMAIATQIQGFLASAKGIKLVIQHVTDLKSAIQHSAKGVYDVVLLDLGLPDSYGLETFTGFHAAAPDIPTVVFTSVDDEERALEALRQGAQDYLVKGEVDSRLLIRAIRYAIERKTIEDRLRESEEKHRTLLEVLPEIVYKISPDGSFSFINKPIEKLGYRADELVGKHFSTIIHPDDLENVTRMFVLPRFKGTETGAEKAPKLVDERRSGERMTKDLVLRLIPKGWDRTNEANCVIGLLTSYGEITATGHYFTDVKTRKRHFIGTVGIIRDITERRKAEDEKLALEKQLRQSQKMEAIGRLAGGVAHDMNNVLGAILGSASVLDDEIKRGHPNREDLDNILAACRKGRDLTRDLLGFARKGKYVKEILSLNDIAYEAQSLLARTITKKISIDLDLDNKLDCVEGDRNQIHHALMNLCINAADAMKTHGTLTIATKNVYLDNQQATERGGLRPGKYVETRVIDTGVGIDAETLKNVFEPFFTTKPKGEGTGLGLAMVYGVVENHGGHVYIESEPGKGTRVVFLLPAATSVAPRKSSSSEIPIDEKPYVKIENRCVLVIDDESVVRVSVRRLLERLGYRTLIAEDGKAALEIYKRNKDVISLVILDLIMPDMDGPETFEALKAVNPNVKVLLSSGYSKDEKIEALLNQGAIGFVQKPFDLQSLSHELNSYFE